MYLAHVVVFDSSYSTYEIGRFLKTNADLGDPKHWVFPNQEEAFFEDEKIPSDKTESLAFLRNVVDPVARTGICRVYVEL